MTQRKRPDGAAVAAIASFKRSKVQTKPDELSASLKIQRTTLSAPFPTMRDARKLAADLNISLNDVFLLGLNGPLCRAGYQPVPGLDPTLEGQLAAVRIANSGCGAHPWLSDAATSPPGSAATAVSSAKSPTASVVKKTTSSKARTNTAPNASGGGLEPQPATLTPSGLS